MSWKGRRISSQVQGWVQDESCIATLESVLDRRDTVDAQRGLSDLQRVAVCFQLLGRSSSKTKTKMRMFLLQDPDNVGSNGRGGGEDADLGWRNHVDALACVEGDCTR